MKATFLSILDDIEENKQSARDYLTVFFLYLIKLSRCDEKIFVAAKNQVIKNNILNINVILSMFDRHFSNRLSSRLPVIAIYSIYEILIPLLSRYKDKKLIDLEVHTSSDKHSFGDIEVYDKFNQPFEVVEIKHNIPITKELIYDVIKKTERVKINRYYVLTTYKKGFENIKVEREINKFTLKIKEDKNMDIIANGILTTIKYYLRLVDDYKIFLEVYKKNLIRDAKYSTEIKNFHIESWIEILKNSSILNS